ncbi:radical SAM domain containing protein [Tritrichomonas foetus]|uniref:Radical SAM domain containing protein n=1 Tax=Tritrichomonas foetus TaxID=1144522 RepID=A0A1J4KJS0_9EUKA|nr:radical SAM domain containing protein [Tritrichomonas foetus]|eukprot:OHT11354.1 radical SAM domain containing protein [Tritrichomonas foetus]
MKRKIFTFVKTFFSGHFITIVLSMSLKKYTVNMHFIRCCNYHCKFCFHRGIEDDETLSLNQWHYIIDNIARTTSVKRINFAGGEPFMAANYTKDLIHYAKSRGLQTSVITNSALFTNKLFDQVKNDLDMIGISVDSGDDSINFLIGRNSRFSDKLDSHLNHVRRVAALCKANNKYLKLNTVICRENLHDDSIFSLMNELQPDRWKVFRVLKIENENGVDKDEREPYTGFLTDQEWDDWKLRCKEKCDIEPVYENNDDMLTSYLLVDEKGYILDSSSGSKERKYSLLENELSDIIDDVGFSSEKFLKRGGLFEITKEIEDMAA